MRNFYILYSKKKKITYDEIRELYRAINPNIDSKLADEFDQHVKKVMIELQNKLK